jgi:DNA-binding MarR family transcriptional regulator
VNKGVDLKGKHTSESIDRIDRVIHGPARLMIMTNLYVVEGGDMVFLKDQTQLSWGNLSVQVRRLEEAGYVQVEKEFVEKKPHTVVSLTPEGKLAFEAYRDHIKEILK